MAAAEILYRIELSYCVCGIIVRKGKVIQATLIMGWAAGKDLAEVQRWVSGKGGSMQLLGSTTW